MILTAARPSAPTATEDNLLKTENLTYERVRELFDYNPRTGSLIRKIGVPGNGSKAGVIAGHLDKKGYRSLSIDRVAYRAHRVIWLWVYGEFPVGEIDHINHSRDDNRIVNLRDVPSLLNHRNMRKNPRSIATGIRWRESSKNWRAQIKVNGKEISLGHFKQLDDAIAAREAAVKKYGFHPNHGH